MTERQKLISARIACTALIASVLWIAYKYPIVKFQAVPEPTTLTLTQKSLPATVAAPIATTAPTPSDHMWVEYPDESSFAFTVSDSDSEVCSITASGKGHLGKGHTWKQCATIVLQSELYRMRGGK